VPIAAYVACPVTAGVGCTVGAGLSYATVAATSISAGKACTRYGVVSAACGVALADVGLSASGAILPGRFAMNGAHLVDDLVWREAAIWNTAFGGPASVLSRILHSSADGTGLLGCV